MSDQRWSVGDFPNGLASFKIVLGIDITAHRLFGPQPKTATYVCIWEIALGSVKGSASAQEISLVAGAVDIFKSNYSDRINAPAEEFGAGVELDGMCSP